MPNFTVGQSINKTSDLSAIPVGAILVNTETNTAHTRADDGRWFTDGASGIGTFRIAYLPTPKPGPLFPLKLDSEKGAKVRVEESYHREGLVFLSIEGDGYYRHFTKDEARKIAHAILAVIGENPAKAVYEKGDEEPTTAGLKLKDKDGDFWFYLPNTNDTGYDWGYRPSISTRPTPTRGSDTWDYVLDFAPLTVVSD